jgi:protein SCO1/2
MPQSALRRAFLGAPVIFGLAAAALALGFASFHAPKPAAEPGPIPPGAAALIQLKGADGHATTLAAQSGSWVVLYLGYQSCPDVCPTSLAYMASERRNLGADGARVHGVFVSVDPTDTPDVVASYVKAFDPEFVGLTGTPAAVTALAKVVGATFTAGGPGERIAHTGTLHLLDPTGRQVDALSPPFAPGELAAKLRSVMGSAVAH